MMKRVGQMMQGLSDMSLTGNYDGDVASTIRNAKTNPDVKERRRQLRAEKKRPKDMPPPDGPDPDFF
jgi:type III secretory pathway component EscU